MKKAEVVVAAIVLIAPLLNLFHIAGSGILIAVSFSLLAVIYMYFGFALFNGIRFRKIFRKESYQDVRILRIAGSVAIGFILAILLMGLMFKFLALPGAELQLTVGVIAGGMAFLLAGIGYFRSKARFYSGLLKRIALFGGLGLILLVLPSDAWLEVKYRNHPAFLEALKNYMASPEDEELRQKLEVEREKMEAE